MTNLGRQLQHGKVPIFAQRFPNFEWCMPNFLSIHVTNVAKVASKMCTGRCKMKTKNGEQGLAPLQSHFTKKILNSGFSYESGEIFRSSYSIEHPRTSLSLNSLQRWIQKLVKGVVRDADLVN